jgi:predicted glycoside hydrolase/deacetylase ChbG (UPF0249 family)
MGSSHAANEAILRCCQEGIETSIEVMVSTPWFPEAVRMLADTNIDVGIHLTLSSEWDSVKWGPLSDCPSLKGPDGYFYPMIYPHPNYPGRSLLENDWLLADIEKEFRAQIEMALKRTPRVSHYSSHMNCTEFHEDVKALVKQLAAEYQLDIVPEQRGVTHAGWIGPHETSEEKISSFLKMIESLEAGKTYLFVDHPGLDTPEMRAIHHIGYDRVAIDRQGVTDAWTSPGVRELIKTRGIQLIGYRDLKET